MDDTCDTVKIKSVYKSVEPKTDFLIKLKNDYINNSSDYDVDVYFDDSNPSNTVAVAQSHGVYYKGNTENSVAQNYVLIVNKKKKRARLLPVGVCNLSQVENKSDKLNLPETNDYKSKINLLSDKFGSKRSKRKLELSKKMTVNAEAVEQQLKSIVDETVIDESYLIELDDGTESLEKLLPKYNRDSPIVAAVYDFNDLLDKTEQLSLLEAAEHFVSNPPVEEDNCSDFFQKHYKLLSTKLSVERLTLLLFADCLLRLFKTHPKALKQKDIWSTISPYSKPIISKLRNEFTEKKSLSTFMKHKIACHAIVAVLLACDYKVYLELLSPSFQSLDTRKLLQLCRLVGLTSSGKFSTGSDILTLKVPLPPLPSSKSPPKKNRR